jgi:hypothetical protein
MARALTTALLALALGVAGGCGPPLPGAFAWRTLRAEHATVVTARRRDGRLERRRVRGLLAAARPDRLRLRALGPADTTLFDLVARGGRCAVVAGPGGAALAPGSRGAAILEALCHDLLAAYRLGPARPGTVRYGDWRRVGASWEPFRLHLDDRRAGFSADVTTVRIALDEAQDPALFRFPEEGR